MKDALFKWTELILSRWAVILPILLFLGSTVGWTFSSVEHAEKDELTDAMKEQIEVLVDYKPKATPKQCNCEAIFNKLIKAHIDKHRSEH